MPQILVVEDSKDAQELIRRALRDAGDVAFAESGSECVELASTQPPDLFLVDVELPDMDGFELCASLKSNAMLENIPVVFLTGRADVQDKVMGFRLGAEDYIAKPFAAAELRVRVEARLRGHGRRDARLAFDDMTLDLVRHEVRLREGDSERVCDLTPHEFRLLHCLAARRGEAVQRHLLVEAAWPGVRVSPRTIDSHVSNLRKKLGPHADRLRAVRGVGYRLASPVRA